MLASVLLSGNVLRVLRAVRLMPKGKMRGLRPVMLAGKMLVDPQKIDVFKTVVDERKRLAKRTDITDEERSRLDRLLKTLANATSYGIMGDGATRASGRQDTKRSQDILMSLVLRPRTILKLNVAFRRLSLELVARALRQLNRKQSPALLATLRRRSLLHVDDS